MLLAHKKFGYTSYLEAVIILVIPIALSALTHCLWITYYWCWHKNNEWEPPADLLQWTLSLNQDGFMLTILFPIIWRTHYDWWLAVAVRFVLQHCWVFSWKYYNQTYLHAHIWKCIRAPSFESWRGGRVEDSVRGCSSTFEMAQITGLTHLLQSNWNPLRIHCWLLEENFLWWISQFDCVHCAFK